MFALSFSVTAGKSIWTPGTLTLLRAPRTPSFITSATSIGPVFSTTCIHKAPSSKRMSSPTETSLVISSYETLIISWVVSIPGRPKIFTTSPVLYWIGDSTLVVRISGPLVSISKAICGETLLVLLIIALMPSGVA